jgi:uncharacterized protein YciI
MSSTDQPPKGKLTLFAVVRTKGSAWDLNNQLRAQQQWSEHASFMDKLAADGFVVLGGPLGDGEEFLLAIRAADEDEVRSVLQRDPWSESGILDLKSVQTWTILLQSPAR